VFFVATQQTEKTFVLVVYTYRLGFSEEQSEPGERLSVPDSASVISTLEGDTKQRPGHVLPENLPLSPSVFKPDKILAPA